MDKNPKVLQDMYTDRISYTGQRSPWTNITVTINDSTLNDSGNYKVEVVTNIPDGQLISTISSPINITITEGEAKSDNLFFYTILFVQPLVPQQLTQYHHQ